MIKPSIFYSDAKGKAVGYEWGNVNLNLSDAGYQKASESGVRFWIVVPLRTPKQILKVIVYDAGSDRVGSKLIKMR